MNEGGEAGSIVIEAMIAALIIAGMAAVLLETITTSAAATRRITEGRQAMLVAQSLMSAAGVSGPVIPGVREGVDGALVWRLAVTPYPAIAGPGGAGLLEQVTVTVREGRPGGARLATLASLRFGR